MDTATETDIQPQILAPTPTPQKLYSAKLGEELPIFCERCGYSLNGSPQMRCADCKILQFHCPECGHHQPINTLRPAAQRILGRLRALWLCFSVFFKLNFFGWLLAGCWMIGGELGYEWQSTPSVVPGGVAPAVANTSMVERDIDFEGLITIACLGLASGLVGRMLLLRWKRGYLVGLILGALVLVAVVAGAWIRRFDDEPPAPFSWNVFTLAREAAVMVVIGAWISWPIWLLLVKLFLPRRAGIALLEWQRSLSDGAKLAQQ